MQEIKKLREPYKPVIIPAIESEVRGLSQGIRESGLLESMMKVMEVVPAEGKGDDSIIDTAVRLKAAVMTNDRELRKRLKSSGVRVFSLRGGRRVEAE